MSDPALILGARSAIAMETARALAACGHDLMLAARRAETLEADAADIALRHDVTVTCHEFDVLDTASHAPFLDALPDLPAIAICAIGTLGDQRASEIDAEAAALVMRANYEGPALILGAIAERMAARGSGWIVGISSVAGERGRASNYVYGSAKAGFTAFLSGLRNRLDGTGVGVTTVLPGFVDTAMTAGMDLPAPLTASAAEAGRAVADAVERKRDVIYVKRRWALVMAIVRALPERVFKRTSF